MGRKPTGLQLARAKLADAGLPFPEIPSELSRRLRERGEWCWATRDVACSPYNLDNYVAEAAAGVVTDYALLAHAGHGANSYALQYYLVWGRLRLFLHLGWGGVYMDEDQARQQIVRCFELAGALIRVLRKPATSDRSVVTIVCSDFYGSRWAPDSRLSSGRVPLTERRDPVIVLEEALAWAEDSGPSTD